MSGNARHSDSLRLERPHRRLTFSICTLPLCALQENLIAEVVLEIEASENFIEPHRQSVRSFSSFVCQGDGECHSPSASWLLYFCRALAAQSRAALQDHQRAGRPGRPAAIRPPEEVAVSMIVHRSSQMR